MKVPVARAKRAVKPKPAPVFTGQVNEMAMAEAMRLAGGDRDRTIITGRTTVVVVNHPGAPLPGRVRIKT